MGGCEGGGGGRKIVHVRKLIVKSIRAKSNKKQTPTLTGFHNSPPSNTQPPISPPLPPSHPSHPSQPLPPTLIHPPPPRSPPSPSPSLLPTPPPPPTPSPENSIRFFSLSQVSQVSHPLTSFLSVASTPCRTVMRALQNCLRLSRRCTHGWTRSLRALHGQEQSTTRPRKDTTTLGSTTRTTLPSLPSPSSLPTLPQQE